MHRPFAVGKRPAVLSKLHEPSCCERLQRWLGRAALLLCTLAVGAACARREPPGGHRASEPVASPVRIVAASADGPGPERQDGVALAEPGSVADNLPFEANGEKLASVAWRTWVYTDVGPTRTRYGNLRAGAVLDSRGPPIVNSGCEGGWYRINPRGFVCIGKGAVLDLQHPVVVASRQRPVRREGLPYLYALADQQAPHLYFKLPKAKEMLEVEGDYTGRAQTWIDARHAHRQWELLRHSPEIPEPLVSGPLTKPYGAKQGLRYAVHAGQASSDSGFAVMRTFTWEGRVFGLTTELDLIALDRTKLVQPSEMSGIVLDADEDLPVAIVTDPMCATYELQEDGSLNKVGVVPKRTFFKVVGEKQRIAGVGYWQTREGWLIPAAAVERVDRRDSFPSVATGNRKWIDVSLKRQLLVAYEGTRAVFATLVSTGAGGLGDPEKVPSTVQGTFMIYAKHVTETMDGDEDKGDSFNLRDVPFVQYFHKGYALHGTYWHDDFGRWRSHGCVNLSPRDAAWLFEWTDPHVPDEWHSVLNKERGTVVHIRP